MQVIQSASIILENTRGEVLICKRNKDLSAFPDLWVFPGGKIKDKLPETWQGDEIESVHTAIRELYEETGILVGYKETIPPDKRNRAWFSWAYDDDIMKKFKERIVFVGRKKTPSFMPVTFDAAYFHFKGDWVDDLDVVVDGSELVESQWIHPKEALKAWNDREIRMPPPIVHLIRTMATDYHNFHMKTLVETNLPIGLQTRVMFAPGISAIPMISNTIEPFISTTTIFIQTKNESIIIDPGTKDHDHLEQLLGAFPDITKVIITHAHNDHWDGLKVIEKYYPDAILMAHDKTLSQINTSLQKHTIDDAIALGEHTIQVIDTPGHIEGHISLFVEPSKTLIAGDHLVGYGSAVLDPRTGNMNQYLESCDKLISLQPYLALPSHGPPIYDPVDRLNQYKEHRLEREKAILDSILKGATTLDDIVADVYTDVPKKMWEYAKMNIQLHIEKLYEDEKIDKIEFK
ncbi:MAG: MBL fold metallo-hydrolase [Candidatus Heimdallarchaeota archaeon]|nr:MBL fold metallo-hydrolase [Candidatus Heimdallarchaeota archaeon]